MREGKGQKGLMLKLLSQQLYHRVKNPVEFSYKNVPHTLDGCKGGVSEHKTGLR